MRRFGDYKSFRGYNALLKRLFRVLLCGSIACVLVLSFNFIKIHGLFNREQNSREVILLKGNNEKMLVKEVGGKRVFHIEGLPAKHKRGVIKVLELTSLPAEVKASLAYQVKTIYDKRLQKLQESCGRKKPYRWNGAIQLISAPKQDLTVCTVQKAASTSWHRLVFKLREPNKIWKGIFHTLNRDHAKALPSMEKERLMNSKDGVRVIAVRHPFARLISGWNDKLNKNHLRDSTRILTSLPGIEEYIQKSTPDEDHIIAFKDFAQYIADRELKGVDIHFKSIEQLCQPCRYPYNYVTKTETSQKNLWWVIDKVGGEMPSFSKHIASGSSEEMLDTASDLWKKEKAVMTAFFKELPIETVVKLKKLYQDDFTRFGYTFDLDTMIAGDVID